MISRERITIWKRTCIVCCTRRQHHFGGRSGNDESSAPEPRGRRRSHSSEMRDHRNPPCRTKSDIQSYGSLSVPRQGPGSQGGRVHRRLGARSLSQCAARIVGASRLREEAEVLRKSIQEFFSNRALVSRRKLRQLFRVGRTSLVVGLVFLAACVVG